MTQTIEQETVDELERYKGQWAVCALIGGASYISVWKGDTEQEAQKVIEQEQAPSPNWPERYAFISTDGEIPYAKDLQCLFPIPVGDS